MRVSIIGPLGLWADISKYVPSGLTELICSGEDGIGFLAEKWADDNYIPKLIIKSDRSFNYPPDRLALVMVDAAEMVVAVWDGMSEYVKLSIDYARKIGKSLKVYVIS